MIPDGMLGERSIFHDQSPNPVLKNFPAALLEAAFVDRGVRGAVGCQPGPSNKQRRSFGNGVVIVLRNGIPGGGPDPTQMTPHEFDRANVRTNTPVALEHFCADNKSQQTE